MSLDLDIILFCFFLGLNLMVGLWAGKKVKSLREYAIGNKDFSTGTLTATIVATWISGGFTFHTLQNIYQHGLPYIIVALGGTISLLLTGQVLAKRMGEFLNNLSIAEAMRDLYGKAVQVITALSGMIESIVMTAIQFKVMGNMLCLLLGVESTWTTLAAAVIVTLYTAFGGIRSVTITDMLQLMTFTVFIPALALIIWHNLQDTSRVVQVLEESPLFSWKETITWNFKTLSMVGMLLNFAIPGFSTPIFQRIAMAKDVTQVQDSFTYAAWIRLLIVFSIAWIAILLLAEPSTKDPVSLVSYIITKYGYPGLKGLIAVGITAMAISTADSNLNASAVLVVNDLFKSFKTNSNLPLIIVKLASLIIALFSLLLALRTQNLLDLLLFASSLYAPIVSIPFLLAILGFRSKTIPVLIGMAAGLTTVILWSIWWDNRDSIIPGMLANLLFLMGSHYSLRTAGGWVGIKVGEPLLLARKKRQKQWHDLIQQLKPTQVYSLLQKSLPLQEGVYSLLGIYVMGATYTSFFTIPNATVIAHHQLYHFIAQSTLITTAALITYPAWPLTLRIKWLITFAWPIAIGYLLFVVGSILVLLSGFHQVQVMIFMLNIIIAVLLLPWQLVALLATVGMMIGRWLFASQGGAVVLAGPVASLQFKIFYGVLLFSGSLIAIIRFKAGQQAKHTQLQEHETQAGTTQGTEA